MQLVLRTGVIPNNLKGTNPSLDRIRKMLGHIGHNYASEITIADLAESAGICQREVQRCFKQILRQSPVNYIQAYRIQMASQMLMKTEESVLNVGMACGFPNVSHFCRIFREHTGLSPKKFRDSCRLI